MSLGASVEMERMMRMRTVMGRGRVGMVAVGRVQIARGREVVRVTGAALDHQLGVGAGVGAAITRSRTAMGSARTMAP